MPVHSPHLAIVPPITPDEHDLLAYPPNATAIAEADAIIARQKKLILAARQRFAAELVTGTASKGPTPSRRIASAARSAGGSRTHNRTLDGD